MTMKNNKPYIAITMGDPAGVGPEVTAKALMESQIYDRCRPFVIGNAAAINDALGTAGAIAKTNVVHSLDDLRGDPRTVDVLDLENLDYDNVRQGELSESSGRAAVEWVLRAGELATSGKVQAIVTAPINKEAASLAGYKDIGHMEIFQRQSGVKEVATMLIAKTLRVVHLTTHRSLRVACDYVTVENVLAKIKLTDEYFRRWGFDAPKIGVAALNPHASDGGLLGDEEQRQIKPSIEAARADSIDATGPIPPDTVFNQAIDGKFDVVLAMYHDQGHIPIKVHDWAGSISVNLGLPFIRTSVDHGTAFDIAGKGIANHQSMLESIKTAVNLATGQGLVK
jgi:4-hydroxythreonine-4-phosphate dehydrogenase